jgi:hypothetical protein
LNRRDLGASVTEADLQLSSDVDLAVGIGHSLHAGAVVATTHATHATHAEAASAETAESTHAAEASHASAHAAPHATHGAHASHRTHATSSPAHRPRVAGERPDEARIGLVRTDKLSGSAVVPNESFRSGNLTGFAHLVERSTLSSHTATGAKCRSGTATRGSTRGAPRAAKHGLSHRGSGGRDGQRSDDPDSTGGLD